MLVMFGILLHVSRHVSAVDLYEGDQVLLLCEFPTFELNDPTVIWSRYDLSPSTVHQRQQEGDELKNQNQLYRNRTSMRPDALETGDLSLNLIKLQLSDSGTYTCSVRSVRLGEKKVTEVQLQVEERFLSWATDLLVLLVPFLIAVGLLVRFRHYFMSVVKLKVDSDVESVLLPCKTCLCLPENIRVEWTNSDNMKLFLYQNGFDLPDEKFWFYKDRTEMKRNLRTGDLSLTLKYPTTRDRGTFTCTVYYTDRLPRNILIKKQVVLQVKGCQVEVEEGVESVQLPFRTTGNLPEDATVEWVQYDPQQLLVHFYQNDSDAVLQEEHRISEFFRGRTEMDENLLKTGDVSLTLKNPTVTDSGRYRCEVKTRDGNTLRKKTVLLEVKERTQANNS